MSDILAELSRWRHETPDALALCDAERHLSYAALGDRVDEVAREFRRRGNRNIALLADNSIDWVVADLAALSSGAALVPVPPYFTTQQLVHLLDAANIDTLLVDNPMRTFGVDARFVAVGEPTGVLRMFRRDVPGTLDEPSPGTTAKITFTSGSTGNPKGVCLSRDGIDAIARILADTFAGMKIERHLCVMPLATLLENVAGVYAPLMLGATVFVLPLREVGIGGSSSVDVRILKVAIERTGAESIILLPQILREMTRPEVVTGWAGTALRFVAVGGARVSRDDLEAAADAGIPVYQGYGLSECNSVVALNLPGQNRPGSVGRPLPGVGVRIAADGEILVRGPRMTGYLNEDPLRSDEIATGDLGSIDSDGYLYVSGRRKSMFITSFGRNVSPEWPEAELLHQPEIAQAVIFGEGMPYNTAVLVPAGKDQGPEALAGAVGRANANLPDYAQVSDWVIADEPFTPQNGLLTPTGKPRREAVILRYLENLPASRHYLNLSARKGTTT